MRTKIHAAVAVLGNPARLLLTPRQDSEYGQAQVLLEVVDQSYDSAAFIEVIRRQGAEAVILQAETAWIRARRIGLSTRHGTWSSAISRH